MSDVIPTPLRSERLALAASFTSFALAGAANTSIGTDPRTAGAVALAVAGVGLLAYDARRVSRRRLARRSIVLWSAFLVVAAVHGAGLETVASAPAGEAAAAALTWATLLSAGASTAFLAFREYGASTGADSPEDRILEGGL